MARRSKGDGTTFQHADGSWRARVTLPDGRRKEIRATTKAAADKRRKALLKQLEQTGQLSIGQMPTVGEWITHWITATADRHKPSTTHGYMKAAARFSTTFTAIKLNRLSIELIEHEYQRLADTGLAGSTRHQSHAVLRAALKSAMQRGHISTNLADLVENKPTADRPKVDTFSTADIAQLERALQSDRLRARWMLALAMGLRPSEARGLEWRHLNWETGMLTIEQQVQTVGKQLELITGTKNTSSGSDRVRHLKLPAFLIDMLREYRLQWLQEHAGLDMWSPDGEPHAWMFTQATRPHRPLSHNSDTASWRRLLERAGLPARRIYTTRHTAATVLIAHGVDAHVVADMLGHTDATFTQRVYVHALAERKEQAVKMLDAIYSR